MLTGNARAASPMCQKVFKAVDGLPTCLHSGVAWFFEARGPIVSGGPQILPMTSFFAFIASTLQLFIIGCTYRAPEAPEQWLWYPCICMLICMSTPWQDPELSTSRVGHKKNRRSRHRGTPLGRARGRCNNVPPSYATAVFINAANPNPAASRLPNYNLEFSLLHFLLDNLNPPLPFIYVFQFYPNNE